MKATEQQFLEAIAFQLDLTGDSLAAFLARFSRANADRENLTLVSFIAWNNQPVDGAQKLQDELATICKILEENGCPIDGQKKRGRAPKGQSPWEQGYKWLWESRFPEWQQHNQQPVLEQGETSRNGQADIDALVQQVRSRCCDKVQRNYSKIELFNRKQVGVDQLYVDVYVLEDLACEIPVDSIPPNYNPREDRYSLGRRKDNKPQSGKDFVETHSRVMVLGKPGAGKSTFLKHLAVACANQEFLADYIPILIELRGINASEFRLLDKNEFNLLRVVHQYFDDLADVEKAKHILKTSKWLILIDGLDEIPSQYHRSLQSYIRNFVREYDQNQFILTCRTQTTEYTISGFDYVEVADFDSGKVKIFAKNWFTAFLGQEKGAKLAKDFLEVLEKTEHTPTAELAKTPILLSLTCWVFLCYEKLPVKRSDLYRKGIDLLLKEWDNKRGIERPSVLNIDDIQNLLSYLAIRKFEQPDNFTLFKQDEIKQYIVEYPNIDIKDSEELLKEIESNNGLLIERAKGVWSFSHLTFQEYFIAWKVVRSSDLEIGQRLNSYILEKHWHEVFLLIAELKGDE
ncbi:NACHT domain-containing protein [Coleofasciculus sp. FACHB-501]|uniref:NACHT domain-containing protein n=1 Tax=Cyanophyceae TaxID=3028117 RepID=UPI0016881E52|nr:NACHT domain-containing protein [Coleofasciculus sp. FACHB-501]MBD1838908.1 NACHT domain-containing protein [Coleofasciculus sp. FACHB-501]